MSKRMLVDASHREETRVVIADGTQIDDFDFEAASKKPLKGNIYLARVTRVEPSLQAAFVEYGGNRHGFLAFSEIHPDYYQIPVADKKRLMEQQAEADAKRAAAEAARDLEEDEAASNAEADAAKPNGGGKSAALSAGSAPTLDLDDPAADAADWDDEDHVSLQDPAEELFAESTEDDTNAESDDADTATDSDKSNGRSNRGRQAKGRGRGRSGRNGGRGGRNSRSDDDDEDSGREARPYLKNYKIQDVIRRRQVLLIQVVKEERGNKGAALTTYLSLAGRYCVLMPNTARGGGISRKITNMSDRRRLKSAVSDFEVPSGMGLIVRTAGANRTKAEVRRDYEYLLRLWESVRDLTLKSAAPSLVYEEGNLIKRSIRDLYSKDIEEVLVEGEDAYKEAKAFMRMLMPSHARHVKLYRERLPLYQRYHVDTQLDEMLSPRVELPSGGYIIINQTEALVSVDVNSGRSTREHNIEDTALKTNLEAGIETARQLRLRDLAGLIVIDFIDMEENRNNRAVERQMKEVLEHDRARIQVGRISNFGLLEMSRQRLRSGILEGSTRPCPHCEGTGTVRSVESAALLILRACEEEGARERSASITVRTNQDTAAYVLNHKRRELLEFEDLYGMVAVIEVDAALKGDEFEIERGEPLSEARRREIQETSAVTPDTAFLQEEEAKDAAAEAEEAESLAAMEQEEVKVVAAPEVETKSDDTGSSDQAAGETSTTSEDATAKRRRRGRRGGRRNKRRPEDATTETGAGSEVQEASDKTAAKTELTAEEKTARNRRRRGSRGGRGRRRADKPNGQEAAAGEKSSGQSAAASGRGPSSGAQNKKPAEPSKAPQAEKKEWWQGWFG